MSPAAFIDTNIPIYAAGRAHPLKEPCRQVLRLIASDSQAFVTSAEVLQEMLHIYLARQEWSQGRQVFQDFLVLMQDRVEAVLVADVQRAARLADTYHGLSSRDLLHVGVMQRLGVRHIVSTDTGFDRIPQVERLDPAKLSDWQRVLLP